jgi:putative cardiolipin synthase
LPAARLHEGASGFRLYSLGIDGLLLRLELIAQAKSSLDLQYYIFHGDESGRLVTEALLQAAQRGVRVRIVVDDAETAAGDERACAAGTNGNRSSPRSHSGYTAMRAQLPKPAGTDAFLHADGAIALIGGRNIGDQYFQVDPDSQFADDDVFITGPVVTTLAKTFAQYWDSELAVPVEAVAPQQQYDATRAAELAARRTLAQKAMTADAHYAEKLTAGEPLASLLAGTVPVNWATAALACDSPDKKHVAAGERAGSLMFGLVAKTIRETQTELLLVTPYLVPSPEEMALLGDLTGPHRRVRILTTSLEATSDPFAEAGYEHHRVRLLQSGVELYELRTHPESTRGSGQSAKMTSYGTYSLHAKYLVFDRTAIYVGSMNYDARSRWLNTEVGLIIYSRELAAEGARRFEAMTQPASAYAVTLEHPEDQSHPKLVWSTTQQGRPVSYHSEPARNAWQRWEIHTLALLPIDHEL